MPVTASQSTRSFQLRAAAALRSTSVMAIDPHLPSCSASEQAAHSTAKATSACAYRLYGTALLSSTPIGW